MRDNNSGAVFLLLLAGLAWLALQPQGCELAGAGADTFVLLHEATKDDESFRKIDLALQDAQSTIGKEVAASGWKVLVLDDNATDKDGHPLPLLVGLGVHGSIEDARRELLSVRSGKLVDRKVLPPDATAESVMAMMRSRGRRG